MAPGGARMASHGALASMPASAQILCTWPPSTCPGEGSKTSEHCTFIDTACISISYHSSHEWKFAIHKVETDVSGIMMRECAVPAFQVQNDRQSVAVNQAACRSEWIDCRAAF